MITSQCDIAIIGGSMGGVAAALAACRSGRKVILTEETDWLGGQLTSQGVSALDEHQYIETFGGTTTYYQLRNAIRAHYQEECNLPDPDAVLNPGNGWVSRLCFEPRIGLKVVNDMLEPYMQNGQLTILLKHKPVDAELDGTHVRRVTVNNRTGTGTHIQASYFLDATELGDLLPLTNTAYVTGAESQANTEEDSAPSEARPTEAQSFTFCFAVEFCPGENHIIAKPEGYERFRDTQPYSLTLEGQDGQPRVFRMFEGELPFWTYRRMRDGSQLGGNDLALINWHGNDYYGRNIIDVSVQERAVALEEAKRLSLGFLYWLQTECPRDDGGQGYPELKLRSDVMGTNDGLSKYPYIRESRRIVPLKRVVAQDITVDHQPLARAANHLDSVGVGWYAMDLHPCVGNPKIHMYSATRPFQIPLGALIPKDTQNLIAACKNIGTTHLSNGAYRLHPIEWNIGESAGALGAFCVETGLSPHQIWDTPYNLWRFQNRLVKQGVPIAWTEDMPQTHPDFCATQLLMVQDIFDPSGGAAQRLKIDPQQPLDAQELNPAALARMIKLFEEAGAPPPPVLAQTIGGQTWQRICQQLQPFLDRFLA